MPIFPRTKPAGEKSSASTVSCSASGSRSCAGRILNRERINKTIEGIYFICAECLKVCHSLDDGLSEDPANLNNHVRRMRQGRRLPPSAAAAAPPKESGGCVAPLDAIAPQTRGRELEPACAHGQQRTAKQGRCLYS